jgi:hypothetical protein
MPRDSRVFPYMYSVQFDGTNYILVDADCKSTNGLTPAELGAKVKDVDRDSRADGRDRIGDVAHDQFHVSQAHGHLNGKYSFVSVSMPSDSSGTGFIALDEKTGDYYYFTDTLVPDSQAGTPLTLQGGDVSICFMPGTKIRTPTGEAAVEDLKVGDLVRTADGRAVGIRWIGRQTVHRSSPTSAAFLFVSWQERSTTTFPPGICGSRPITPSSLMASSSTPELSSMVRRSSARPTSPSSSPTII